VRKIHEREVTAQCKKCLDIFSVEVTAQRDRVEVFGGSATSYDGTTLRHKCGGIVRLIWMPHWGPIVDLLDTWDPGQLRQGHDGVSPTEKK